VCFFRSSERITKRSHGGDGLANRHDDGDDNNVDDDDDDDTLNRTLTESTSR